MNVPRIQSMPATEFARGKRLRTVQSNPVFFIDSAYRIYGSPPEMIYYYALKTCALKFHRKDGQIRVVVQFRK